VSQVQQLPTSGIVKSRLGEIELNNGYPTEASVKKIYRQKAPRCCWVMPAITAN
jgi:hypothetical protein